jgi:hypothetical protein
MHLLLVAPSAMCALFPRDSLGVSVCTESCTSLTRGVSLPTLTAISLITNDNIQYFSVHPRNFSDQCFLFELFDLNLVSFCNFPNTYCMSRPSNHPRLRGQEIEIPSD